VPSTISPPEGRLEYGYRLREIADYLGAHYTAVSRRLRALETDKKGDV
jgi:hypothetical protein